MGKIAGVYVYMYIVVKLWNMLWVKFYII
jgi:hypothetical protein